MKSTEQSRVKKVAPGVRSYRGFIVKISETIPSGYWGHWESDPVHGKVLKTETLTAMKAAIDRALRVTGVKAKPKAEAAPVETPKAEDGAIARGLTYAVATISQPAGPWHVVPNPKPWGMEYDVMPSPEVVEGSRAQIAEGIRQWHVALMMASAPEMVTLLQRVESVMRLDHAENTFLYRSITMLLASLKAAPPEVPATEAAP